VYYAKTVPASIWQDKELTLNDIRFLLALISLDVNKRGTPSTKMILKRAKLPKEKWCVSRKNLQKKYLSIDQDGQITILFQVTESTTEVTESTTEVTESTTIKSYRIDNQKVVDSTTSETPTPILLEKVIQSNKKKKEKKNSHKPQLNAEQQIIFQNVLNCFNGITGTKRSESIPLRQRIIDGKSEKDMLQILENQKWKLGDDLQFKNYNVDTLFRDSHFDDYLNPVKKQDSSSVRDEQEFML
jgi:hypothetical protein